jgi:hypothetical protein
VIDAALALADCPPDLARSYASRLTSGGLDLLSRSPSDAKNILWELECHSILRSVGFDVILAEPDVVVRSPEGPMGFACKKIYSEANIEKVLSEAVQQIRDSNMPGVLAVNLDECVPDQAILRVNSLEELRQICNSNNYRFLTTHKRHIEKYCCTGRALAIWVATAVVADIRSLPTRLNNSRESVMWSSTVMPDEDCLRVRNFVDRFTNIRNAG